MVLIHQHIDGLVQDCSISTANVLQVGTVILR